MIALRQSDQFGSTLLIATDYVKVDDFEEGPIYQFTRWLRLDQMVAYSTKVLLSKQDSPTAAKTLWKADFDSLNQELPNVDLSMDDIVAEMKAARRDRQSSTSRHF